MKFSNGRKMTVISILMLGFALYLAFTGGDTALFVGCLILSNLECE